MFRGGQVNPYDDIVVKATDENQTSENWEILINLCDKVSEDGEQGARNVIAALLKRLTHRNANVQLYALSVAEALSKNCDITVHREMASKAFTQGLANLATDRNGHEKVKKRTLGLIKLWAGEFAHDPQLGLMEECYSSLKAKGMRFEDLHDNPAPQYDDEAARREEEELQRVLEMSKVDKGGRDRWNEYTSYGMSGASGSGSGSQAGGSGGGPAYTPAAQPAVASSSRQPAAPAPAPVQAQAPAPAPVSASVATPVQAAPIPAQAPPPAATPAYTPAPAANSVGSPVAEATPLDPSTLQIVKRVRALHDFAATEVGELSFKKGDVIKVVDRCFKDWWRGQMKGRTGIFPVNYVEPLPEPTAAELAKDAEAEALVFSQGGAIDTLLQKLREFDPAAENLNDNEEIQELYRSSMSLRPKILKLIDKYSQKKAELVVMNERYVKARNTFERMMEESVAKHNPAAAVYDYQPPAGPDQYGQPGNRATVYGWNQSLYGQGAGVLQPTPDPAAYAYQQQQAQQAQQQQQPPAPVPNVPQEYPPQPYGQPGYQGQDQYVQQYAYAGYQPQPQPGQEQAQGQGQYPQPYPGAQQHGQPQQQPGQPQQGPPQQQPYQQQPGQPQPGQPQPGQPQPGQAQPGQPQPGQPQPGQPQPQLQHNYSYAGEPKSPGQQPQPQPQQQPYPEQAVQPQQHQPGYGQPPEAQQGYAQPHDPQQGYAQPHDPQAQAQGQAQQHPPGYGQPVDGQPGYGQPGYQPQPQAQAQGQPQQQQPQHGYQLADQGQQPQHQVAEQQPQQAQQQPQEAAQAQPAPDAGPPYPWNGTAKYPNQGACQWAEYYLGGGDDPSGLVYFTGPDGNVLASVPPRDGGFGTQMQALQQGFAGVGLGDGQGQAQRV